MIEESMRPREMSHQKGPLAKKRRRQRANKMEVGIAGARILELAVHKNKRGALVALEKQQGLPFSLKRVFCIFDVPASVERANHSITAPMLLMTIKGAVTATCDNGSENARFRLDRCGKGLYVKPGVLLKLSGFAPQTVLLVASPKSYAEVRYFDRPVFGMKKVS